MTLARELRRALGPGWVIPHQSGQAVVVDERASISLYEDGPLIVRGAFRLADSDGNEIDPGRKTIALCRCGRSKIKPFCDGTHKLTKWRAAGGPETASASER